MTVQDWFLSIYHLASVDGKHHDFLPGIIEDELISIFTRLEDDVFTWHDAEYVTMHPVLEEVAVRIIQAIPTQRFENLNTARKYCDIMLRQIDRFIQSEENRPWTAPDTPLSSGSATYIDKFSPDDQKPRVKIFQEGLSRWHKAFKPLFAKILTSGGKDVLVAQALALRSACSAIGLNCCLGPELSYDAYFPEFRRALSLASTLWVAASSNPKPTFIISSILIKSLYFIALKCRDKPLRTRATSLLQSMSRREGIWDSRVANTVATAVIQLEGGGGSGDSFVPEHRRLKGIKVSFNLHKCRGTMRYLIRNPGAGGSMNHEIELSW